MNETETNNAKFATMLNDFAGRAMAALIVADGTGRLTNKDIASMSYALAGEMVNKAIELKVTTN